MRTETKPMDVIGFIRRYAIVVLGASVVGGVLVAIYSVVFLKDYYAASGQVLVVPPKYMQKIELAPERPGIRTYDSMLNSDEILSGVFQRIIESRKYLNDTVLRDWDKVVKDATSARELLKCSAPAADWLVGLEKEDLNTLASIDLNEDEWRRFEQFRKSFESWFDIDKETNVELIYSPLLKLGAESTDRRMAAIKCNLWIDIFVAQMRLITQAQTKDTVTSIIDDFGKVSDDLNLADEAIQHFEVEHNVDLLQQELATKKEILLGGSKPNAMGSSGEEGTVMLPVLVEEQYTGRLLAKEEGALDSLDREIRSMQTEDGAWIGWIEYPTDLEKELEVVTSRIKTLIDESERLRKASSKPFGMEVAKALEDATREALQPALTTLLAKKACIEASLRLADFARATRIDSALAREKALKKAFGFLAEAGLVESVTAAAYAQQLAGLRAETREMPKTVRYRDSLPLDVLLPALQIDRSAAGLVALASVELQREGDSPEYAEMVRHLTESISRAALSRGIADAITGSLDAYAALLADVTAENIILQVGLDLLNDAKELAKTRLDASRDQYRSSQEKRVATLARINQLRGTYNTLSLESAGLIDDISKAENLLKEWKVTLTQLERKQSTLKDSYNVMAERVKEARLQATAAPEDVRIAARAMVPDRKTGPHRSLIVLAALIFSCLFFILAAIVWEYIVRRPENA